MKKLICMILTMSMVLFTVSPVFATQVITFDEDGTGKVKPAWK